jgi:hypothetical protein
MDPFFAELRRRHPDIDIVLLPPEPPPDETDTAPDPAVVEELARIVTGRRR